MEVRENLIADFKQRGRSTTFIDNRIAESSSKLSEDDKMKLRYMRE